MCAWYAWWVCCVVLVLVLATWACFSPLFGGFSGPSVVRYTCCHFLLRHCGVYYHDSLIRVGRVAFACPVRCGAVAAARLVTLLPTATCTWMPMHSPATTALKPRAWGISYTRQPCMPLEFGCMWHVAPSAGAEAVSSHVLRLGPNSVPVSVCCVGILAEYPFSFSFSFSKFIDVLAF